MNFKKFLSSILFGVVGFSFLAQIGNCSATPSQVYSDRSHIEHLDRSDSGLAIFSGNLNNGTESVLVYSWVIVNKDNVKSSFNGAEYDYLENNQFKIVSSDTLKKKLRKEVLSYFDSSENHFLGLEHYFLLLENWTNKAELPASSTIPGITIHYYKSTCLGTWYGYLIDDIDTFKHWCTSLGMSDGDVKVLTVCQNTWIRTEALSWTRMCDTVELLPGKFKDSLNMVRTRFREFGHIPKEGLKNFVVPAEKSSIGSTIDTSDATSEKIKNQLRKLGISSEKAIKEVTQAAGFFSSSISWKIESLKSYGYIS